MHSSSKLVTNTQPIKSNDPSPTEKRENGLSHFIQLTEQDPKQAKEELLIGLTAEEAHISPKYLYDGLGSKLFEAICELPEYYITRTEALIFEQYAAEISKSTGTGMTLIDLGAGNCAKARRLFPYLQPKRYVPIDISIEFLRDAVERLQHQFPQIEMIGLGMDYSSGLDLPSAVHNHNRLFFWPGSSVSNFTPEQSLAFFKRIHAACVLGDKENGGILVSVDLVKQKEILDAAYDDALGVTASFNRNLLRRLNDILDANFDLSKWQHRSFFNIAKNRIEMHLEAKSSQSVRWSQGERCFKMGERIHTESSYKYTRQNFVKMLTQAGFRDVVVWSDPREWFMVCHAKADHRGSQ